MGGITTTARMHVIQDASRPCNVAGGSEAGVGRDACNDAQAAIAAQRDFLKHYGNLFCESCRRVFLVARLHMPTILEAVTRSRCRRAAGALARGSKRAAQNRFSSIGC